MESSQCPEARSQGSQRKEECLQAAWPCACGETLQVSSRLEARSSKLQKAVLGTAGPRAPAPGGMMPCLRLGNKGKENSEINGDPTDLQVAISTWIFCFDKGTCQEPMHLVHPSALYPCRNLAVTAKVTASAGIHSHRSTKCNKLSECKLKSK